MYWHSKIENPRCFQTAVKADAEHVFLSGYRDGRKTDLTLATILEIDANVMVLGPMKGWQVNVWKAGRRCTTARVLR